MPKCFALNYACYTINLLSKLILAVKYALLKANA